MTTAVRAAYSGLMWLAQPLLRRKLRRRGVLEPGYLSAVEERFGGYGTAAAVAGDGGAPAAGPLVWIHAVSVGETRAAAPLVAALRERVPGMRLLLTHGTATGRAQGQELLRPGDLQAWQPWDTRQAAARFVAHFRPRIGVLMETEVWPNLVHACQAASVPLVLANARLNDHSTNRARRLGWLARPAFASLKTVLAQSDGDAERLRSVGARVHGVFGNLKFDIAPDAALLERGRRWRAAQMRPVVLLASAREGEEAQWLQALRALRNAALSPDSPYFSASAHVPPTLGAIEKIATLVAETQWLVVPRHPQRFDDVQRLIEAEGLSVRRRSGWPSEGDAPLPSADVWLGDSMGEMPLYYGLADVALLGGSFGGFGGQNLIEAAACGCPVVMGPSTFNFADAAQGSEAAGAALRVADMPEGVRAAAALARDFAPLQSARQAAVRFAASHRGAAARTADCIVELMHPGAVAVSQPL